MEKNSPLLKFTKYVVHLGSSSSRPPSLLLRHVSASGLCRGTADNLPTEKLKGETKTLTFAQGLVWAGK